MLNEEGRKIGRAVVVIIDVGGGDGDGGGRQKMCVPTIR